MGWVQLEQATPHTHTYMGVIPRAVLPEIVSAP